MSYIWHRQEDRQFKKKAGLISASASTFDRLVSKTAHVQSAQEVKIVNTSFLATAYEEYGSEGAFPIILIHGFPYDVCSFDGVVGPLVVAGCRVLLPYVRGYCQTRFLDSATPRMAEQVAIAQDRIDFAYALNLDRFVAAGFDWGNRAI